MTAAEKLLVAAIRSDAQIGCAPRRTGLPAHALAGVECTIGSALVERVGVYGFKGHLDASGREVDTAREAYLARMAEAKVALRSGDCDAGRAGDRAWPDYLPDLGEDGGPSATRIGCFLDQGTANVRLTCYGDIYIGILGATADIAGLNAWTWKIAKGESTHRDPPGICAAPD